MFKRGLSVLPGGHGINHRHRQLPVPEKPGKVQLRPDLDRRRILAMGNQHKAVPQQIATRPRYDQTAFSTSSIQLTAADRKMSAGAPSMICLASAFRPGIADRHGMPVEA